MVVKFKKIKSFCQSLGDLLLTLTDLSLIKMSCFSGPRQGHPYFKENAREWIMPEIMTTKELAKYLKLHEITICKYAAEGKIPAIRIGRVWRFDKEAIDKWISGGQKK